MALHLLFSDSCLISANIVSMKKLLQHYPNNEAFLLGRFYHSIILLYLLIFELYSLMVNFSICRSYSLIVLQYFCAYTTLAWKL